MILKEYAEMIESIRKERAKTNQAKTPEEKEVHKQKLAALIKAANDQLRKEK